MSDESILNSSLQDENSNPKSERVNPIIEREVAKVFIKEMEKGDVLPVLTAKEISDKATVESNPNRLGEERKSIHKWLPRIPWLEQVGDSTEDVEARKYKPTLKEFDKYMSQDDKKVKDRIKESQKEDEKYKNTKRRYIKIDNENIELSDEDLHTYVVVSRALAESKISRNGITVSNKPFIEIFIMRTSKCTKEEALEYFDKAKEKRIILPLDDMEDEKTYYCLNDIKEQEEN